MARIRTIKPEFWVDDQIVELDYPTRLLFIGLWNFVDDDGYVEFKAKRIKMQVFPADSIDVSGMLTKLIQMGRLGQFHSDQGDLLRIVNWERHQKISHPTPTRFTGIQPVSSVSPPERSGVVEKVPDHSGLKGKERKGKEEPMSTDGGRDSDVGQQSPYSDDFLSWWRTYPRKESKGDAWKAWEQLRKSKQLPDVTDLNAATLTYARRKAGEPQFIKLPGGWLRDRKWEDETTAATAGVKAPSEFDWMQR
jgi:hypothetical protein